MGEVKQARGHGFIAISSNYSLAYLTAATGRAQPRVRQGKAAFLRAGTALSPSLRAKRSNPSRHKEVWIASLRSQ